MYRVGWPFWTFLIQHFTLTLEVHIDFDETSNCYIARCEAFGNFQYESKDLLSLRTFVQDQIKVLLEARFGAQYCAPKVVMLLDAPLPNVYEQVSGYMKRNEGKIIRPMHEKREIRQFRHTPPKNE